MTGIGKVRQRPCSSTFFRLALGEPSKKYILSGQVPLPLCLEGQNENYFLLFFLDEYVRIQFFFSSFLSIFSLCIKLTFS